MKHKVTKPIKTTVFPVAFQRTEESPLEWGIAIGNTSDIKIIIDSEFQPVKGQVFDYYVRSCQGLLPINTNEII